MNNSASQQVQNANDTQAIIASLLHEIQNELQVIKMEFDLLLMSGGEKSSAQCLARASARIIKSVQKLQDVSGCSSHCVRRRTPKGFARTRTRAAK
jgi:hypothetical protein